MSRWTHRICADCWIQKIREGQDWPLPSGVLNPEVEPCCFCGVDIISPAETGGIYVRFDPDELNCKGVHKDD